MVAKLLKIKAESGEFVEEERLIVTTVKKGWKNGTQLVFPNEGNQDEGATKPGNSKIKVFNFFVILS